MATKSTSKAKKATDSKQPAVDKKTTWYTDKSDGILVKLYGDMKVPADQLAGNRAKLLEMTRAFKEQSGLKATPEQVVQRVINLRKRGKLPKLMKN